MLNPQRILEGKVWERVNLFILRLRNLNTVAEGHFLKEPYSRHLNEASERRKKKDLLFEERQRRV